MRLTVLTRVANAIASIQYSSVRITGYEKCMFSCIFHAGISTHFASANLWVFGQAPPAIP